MIQLLFKVQIIDDEKSEWVRLVIDLDNEATDRSKKVALTKALKTVRKNIDAVLFGEE